MCDTASSVQFWVMSCPLDDISDIRDCIEHNGLGKKTYCISNKCDNASQQCDKTERKLLTQ